LGSWYWPLIPPATRLVQGVVGAGVSKILPVTFRFSGVAYAKLSPVVRVLCAVADRCC
jgi:hypothetical protein